MSNMDMSQYLDVFLEESREHLENLNRCLLELEKNPDNMTMLNEIFRAAHTLKGMSSTMGFDSMADLTHHLENVLSDLKNGLIRVDTGVVDVLFRCLDQLQIMVDRIQEGKSHQLDNSELIRLLQEIKSGITPSQTLTTSEVEREAGIEVETKANEAADTVPEPVEDEQDTIPIQFNVYDITLLKEAFHRALGVYYILIGVDKGCLMKSVRAFMVFKSLEEEGEIIKTDPPAQELDEGKFEDRFHVILVTKADEKTIVRKLNSISEIKVVRIQRLSADMINKDDQIIVPAQEEKTPGAETEVDRASRTDEAVDDMLRGHTVKHTVRVDIEKLDNLMNLVGELVINKGRLEQIGTSRHIQELNETIEQMERITNELQSVVMKVRMVPIEQVFNRFPRMVRDLARDLGKELDFVIEGKETELDRTVIDEIGDPLVHLLRNSVDHGIEDPETRVRLGKPRRGLVKLSARHEGNNVYIEVQDDGRGLDLEAIRRKIIEKGLLTAKEVENLSDEDAVRFIFESGFSTSENITSISGRGVGMDVVKNKIESLNGEIFVESQPHAGTTFKIRLPLTLAIIQALLVKVGNETYAIPLTSVDETTMISPQDIKIIQGQEVVLLRGTVLPLARARRLLEYPGEEQHEDMMYVVVVRKAGRQTGLIVDSLIGQQEIVIKSLGRLLTGIPGLAGATILGDGEISLILDVNTLM